MWIPAWVVVGLVAAYLFAKYQYEDHWWIRWPSRIAAILIVVGIPLGVFFMFGTWLVGLEKAITGLLLVIAGGLLEWRVGLRANRQRPSAATAATLEKPDEPTR